MDEIQIAKSKAEILDKLANSSNYPENPTGRVSAKLGGEEVDWERIRGVTAELALWQARATNRDFLTVLAETELRVTLELARILKQTLDPVLKGLREVVEEEEGGGFGFCGVCQEEMEVGEDVGAMGCKHKFHVLCIYRWLKQQNAILCQGRRPIYIQRSGLEDWRYTKRRRPRLLELHSEFPMKRGPGKKPLEVISPHFSGKPDVGGLPGRPVEQDQTQSYERITRARDDPYSVGWVWPNW